MIALFVCECHGAENMVRSVLKSAKHPEWLSMPVYKGRKQADAFFEHLPPEYNNDPSMHALANEISRKSQYAIVLGYANGGSVWSNVAGGDIKSRLDGELIAEKFA